MELLHGQFPNLLSTLEQLNKEKIDWMIGGSGCLFLLGNDRAPKDIDILLRNEDHDRADALFGIKSFEYISSSEIARNSNPFNDHDIQLTSHLRIMVDGKQYDLTIHNEIIDKRLEEIYGTTLIWLMPPEEVLLIKALLRRGAEVGKNDLKDINAFTSLYSLDREYINNRAHALGAEAVIADILTL